MADSKALKIIRDYLRWKQKEGTDSRLQQQFAPYLPGADLSFADLRGADLADVRLMMADLRSVDLTEALLLMARLNGAKLVEAKLTRTDLTFANLMGADLTRADLTGARLDRAILDEAILEGATVGATVFAGVDLRKVRGLGAVVHRAPSIIDFSTLQKSHAAIPAVFLRGTGFLDSEILNVRLLAEVDDAMNYDSVFLSYSTKDQRFAERLHADLQANGVRCWFAPEDIQGGKKLHEQIDEAIRLTDRLLLVLSASSVASPWVEHEIRRARRREVTEGRRILFPVGLIDYETLRNWECFDADTGKDLAIEIREYFIPDFSTWKHDRAGYERALDRLLRDLGNERPRANRQ